MVVRPDWGGGNTLGRTAPALRAPRPSTSRVTNPRPISRAPKPYAQPIPVGPTNPVWTPSPTVYNSPYYSAPAPVQGGGQSWGNAQAAAGSGFNGSSVGATGGGTAQSAAVAVEKPKPQISEADWLSGDVEYQNEIKGYDDTLKDFLARITTQETDFKNDYGVAVKGFNRNKDRGLLGIGEDFTSRGLANSGMFADARTKANTQYKEQETGMKTAKTRGLADFTNQKSDKQRSTDTQKGNARRSSLARMAQKQEF